MTPCTNKHMVSLWAVHSVQCFQFFCRISRGTILFDSVTKPCMYQRYVDNTIAIFKTERDSEMFFNKLNSLRPSLKCCIRANARCWIRACNQLRSQSSIFDQNFTQIMKCCLFLFSGNKWRRWRKKRIERELRLYWRWNRGHFGLSAT